MLLHAYGIGPATVERPDSLQAPQATLMASVADGVFGAGLPWGMVAIGMALAVAVIILDVTLENRGSSFRTPVLAVAVGIYLPLELEVPIFLGGILAWLAGRKFLGKIAAAEGEEKSSLEEKKITGERHGLLFAAGLITGEALVGILMAIPIVISGRGDVLAIFGVHPWIGANWNYIGMAILAGVMFWLYKVAIEPLKEKS